MPDLEIYDLIAKRVLEVFLKTINSKFKEHIQEMPNINLYGVKK